MKWMFPNKNYFYRNEVSSARVEHFWLEHYSPSWPQFPAVILQSRGWSDPTPKAQTENIWLHFQHGYKTNWNQGAKSTPYWTENKILQPRPISGHDFSWKVDDTVSIVLLQKKQEFVQWDHHTWWEAISFFKKTCSGLELSLPACLYFKQLLTSFHGHPISQNLVRLFTCKWWLGKLAWTKLKRDNFRNSEAWGINRKGLF